MMTKTTVGALFTLVDEINTSKRPKQSIFSRIKRYLYAAIQH